MKFNSFFYKVKFITFPFVLFILFSSCNEESVNSVQNNSGNVKTSAPFIMDTLNLGLEPFTTFGKESIRAVYLYFGPKSDTILIGGEFTQPKLSQCDIEVNRLEKLNPDEVVFYSPDCEYWNPYKKWSTEGMLRVKVDTLNIVSKPISHYYEGFYKGYVVTVETVSQEDSIDIGYGFYLPMEIQAKDSAGEWRSIEERTSYGCGNQLFNVILPPDYIVISSVYVYDGNYQTELRIKYGANYSNTFSGKINYGQFENNGKSYFYSPPPPAPKEE